MAYTESRHDKIYPPVRSKVRAFDVRSGAQDNYDLGTVFGNDWTSGQYFSLICTAAFRFQFSDGASDVISTTVVTGDNSGDLTEDNDQVPYYWPADVEFSFVPDHRAGEQHLHVIGAAAGTLYVRVSSKTDI